MTVNDTSGREATTQADERMPVQRHFGVWPARAPKSLPLPQTHLYRNVEVSAMRYGKRPFVLFYDTPVNFQRFQDESELIAGYLQQDCGVKKGDRVLLCMQNSPQFMLAYYAILRADAVVVPVNPMNVADEWSHCAQDCGARVAFVAQDLADRVVPLIGTTLSNVIVATYSDYVSEAALAQAPDFVRQPRDRFVQAGVLAWADVLAAARSPTPMLAGPDDLALLAYTSGTTGRPKGCMHTHRSTMVNAVAPSAWFGTSQGNVSLVALPMFHVTGMQGGLNAPMYLGSTVVLLPRWNREAAADYIRRYRVTSLNLITTMVVDLLASPDIAQFDLSSVRSIGGGGAAMPEAVALSLFNRLGLRYSEGYGMSETMGATHMSPPDKPKAGSLGIPSFDVDARIVHPETLAELGLGEVGEIVVNGPQVMLGYWNSSAANEVAFVQLEGKRFLRTGDLGSIDDDGYFLFADRLKRMINAAGFKVWPAEVEAVLHGHPAVQEACVIAAHHPRRGETVKALIVLRSEHVGLMTAADLMTWAREHMAAYKCPHEFAFVNALPKSAAGKILWRQLQEEENRARSV